tara:strand:- start:1200 stop:2756 length:1557 start_codon:yes stop_codon:yes gene_type:complete
VADPCGVCERCLAADKGAEVDLIEIDGASNNGVDQVRALRDQAGYVPLRARFKVYLIDEVHMLSKPAFNALLKTLEEPPPHVKFLFATTEPHKVLDTILSRCQVLKLTTLPEDVIAGRLDQVLAAEGITCEAGVTREVARRARGGMRDALSLADQLISQVGAGQAPTLADCAGLDESSAGHLEVLEAAAIGDRGAVLVALPQGEGAETELIGGLLDRVRAALLAHLCGADAPMLNGIVSGEPERLALASLGERIGPGRAEAWLQELLHARERMRLLPAHARVILEVTLLDMCRQEGAWDMAELAERLAALESRLTTGAPAAAPGSAPARPPAFVPPPRQNSVAAAPSPAPAAPVQAAPAPVQDAPVPAAAPTAPAPQPPPVAATPAPTPNAAPTPAASAPSPGPARVRTSSAGDAWQGFLDELKDMSPSLGTMVERRGKLVRFEQNLAVVQLKGLNPMERPMLEDRRNQKTCQRAIATALGREIELELQDADNAVPGREDPFTNQVAKMFEGRIEDER